MVKPVTDIVLAELNGGQLAGEVQCGPVSWSNELVNHVVELKFSEPSQSLKGWDLEFNNAILGMNKVLERLNCVLLPTAMHPFMDPSRETVLWAHGQKDIYHTYDRIFGCKGHGWSNLQSVHINLSYGSEADFVKLHAAIRGVLPIIPFLSASSPFCEGRRGDSLDTRLSFYELNQQAIPSIAGKIIPESVENFADYNEIYKTIYSDLSPYDPEGVIQHPWVNSRGAIPKFEFNAIEIRVMDIQESSYMDFCLISFFVAMIRRLLGDPRSLREIGALGCDFLKEIYLEGRRDMPGLVPSDYSRVFGVGRQAMSYIEFSTRLFELCKGEIPDRYHEGILVILDKGNLAKRLLASEATLKTTYRQLAEILSENRYYESTVS